MTFRVRMVFLSLFILVLFVVSDIRNASAVVDPLTGYIVASALFHAVVIGGAVAYKYFKRENGGSASSSSHKIGSSTGTIGREATVTWVSLASDGQINQNTKNVSAKINYSDLSLMGDSAQYPNIKNAINDAKRSYTIATDDTGWDVNSVYTDGSFYYKWTSKGDPMVYTGSSQSSTGTIQFNSMLQKYYVTHTFGGTNGYTRQTFYGDRLGTTPPLPNAIPDKSKLIKNLDTNSDGNIESVFKGEIDDFIKSNPNIVHYADTTDAGAVDISSDFVGPPTPSAYDLASAAARTAAAEATRNAWLNYSSNKGDLTARQIWLNRVAQDAKDAATDEQSSIAPGSSPSAYGDGSTFDFQSRFSQFFTDVKATTLFSLPNKIVSSLPSGGSPVVSINCGRWGVRTVDFSAQSQILSIIKTILLIAFSFVAIKIVVLKGGGG